MPFRIMAWNIRQGVGTRVADVLEVIDHHRPDVLVLMEFRHNTVAPQLSSGLMAQGLAFQAAPNAPPRKLSVLLGSRLPFAPATLEQELPAWPFRAIRGQFNRFTLFGFYIPTGERKRPVLHFMRNLAAQHSNRPTLLISDFNTGLPVRMNAARN